MESMENVINKLFDSLNESLILEKEFGFYCT